MSFCCCGTVLVLPLEALNICTKIVALLTYRLNAIFLIHLRISLDLQST